MFIKKKDTQLSVGNKKDMAGSDDSFGDSEVTRPDPMTALGPHLEAWQKLSQP